MTDKQPIFTPDMFRPSSEVDPLALTFDYDRHRDAVANRVMADMAAGRARAAKVAAEREQRDTLASEAVEEQMPRDRDALLTSAVDNQAPFAAATLVEVEASIFEKIEAERKEREAVNEAIFQALEQQDADYHAHQVTLEFAIGGASLNGEPLEEWHDPSGWEVVDDEAANQSLVADLVDAATAALEPWTKHFHALGMVRHDLLSFCHDRARDDGFVGPIFHLVHRAADADLSGATLGAFEPVCVELSAPQGARLTISARVLSTNPTMLFEAMQRRACGVGQWGGDFRPDVTPIAEESRDQWLERVSLSRDTLGRAVERWVACGRDPYLFARFGDWTERASGSDEIAWVVDGIIPRGEVMLLAGASGAGKSSVAHSWLGALGATADDCPRHVLGRPVTGRYFCCLVAGEEGAGSINYREKKHTAAWGPSRYMVLGDPDRSLVDHIDGLHTLPNLDLVVIDTVGAFFDGEEKSSRAVREFMAPLVKLARVKNCAVILVHHLTKFGEGVKSIAGLKAHVLGAGAFVSTCRLAVGVIRIAGDKLEVGPFKSNIPPELLWLPVGSGRQYLLNERAYTLDPIREKDAASSLDAEIMDFICDAIAEQNRMGRVVRRTGRHEIWERKLPELDGFSRVALRAAVAELIGADRILDGPDGLVAVFPTLGGFGEAE